jgi:aspartyl-tRNA(Asn)/glutamyl-tRNA(Gln) amidotransferase subunit B
MPDGTMRDIGITRLHLEQDAGKMLHDQHPSLTYVDLNRAGVALMEIVSEPDMRSAEEAGEYLKKVRSIMRYLGTCDGNMEEGSLRCDCNVSVRRPGGPLGTRAEIKNVNSFRYVEKAINHEVERQIALLEGGGQVVQETRLYDPDRGETRSMRSKEEANDYRYFPDPDLLPVELDEAFIREVATGLPELPDQKARRFETQYQLSAYDAQVLTASAELATYYEAVVREFGGQPKLAANWVAGDLAALLNRDGLEITASRVGAPALALLLRRIDDRTISGKIAKDVFQSMWDEGQDADAIIAVRGLRQITDDGSIEQAIAAVLAANPRQLADFRAGKDKLFGFFIGQVMKATQGKANPERLNQLLRKALGG